MKKRKDVKKKKNKFLIIFLLLLVIFFGILGWYFFFAKEEGENSKVLNKIVEKIEKKDEEVKKVKIVDVDSDTRNIAVMINNHPSARKFHSGIQDAYIVYEIIVEGGYTRLMALYKDVNVSKIGSVRSSRHYFLDYALENDAVYVHWGWSPQAQEDISRLGVNNINGLTYEGKYFYRDNSLNVDYEHRGFTDSDNINAAIKQLGYRNTTDKDLLLNYVIDDIDLSSMEGSQVATNVNIKYSNSVTTSYVYDEVNKVYLRSVNGESHVDYDTKKQYTVKNIITYQVSNYTISGDSKGRQDINNIGSGSGYYISNGYAVPVLWEKSSRISQTKYSYLDGTEINVNDGNTFIQIQPKNQSLNIS